MLPGFVDTLMCGCGGNVFAFAVTSKRLIIQVPLAQGSMSPRTLEIGGHLRGARA